MLNVRPARRNAFWLANQSNCLGCLHFWGFILRLSNCIVQKGLHTKKEDTITQISLTYYSVLQLYIVYMVKYSIFGYFCSDLRNFHYLYVALIFIVMHHRSSFISIDSCYTLGSYTIRCLLPFLPVWECTPNAQIWVLFSKFSKYRIFVALRFFFIWTKFIRIVMKT